MMKYSRGLALACLLAMTLAPVPALAQANGATYNGSYPNSLGASYEQSFAGYANATAGATFGTSSYATLMTISFTPKVYDPTVTTSLLDVIWNADVTKATSGGGNCEPFINGALVTQGLRTWTLTAATAPNGVLIGETITPNTTKGAQVQISVKCESSDTATFTINQATMKVIELVRYAPTNP